MHEQPRRLDLRLFGSGQHLPTEWELYVDGEYAARGPRSSYPLMQELVMLYQMVMADG